MTRYFIAAVLLGILGYGFVKAEPLLFGPVIRVDAPQNGSSVDSGVVEVTGMARRAAALTINGATVLPEAGGRFSAALPLPKGGSILTIVATDRFGRSATRVRHLYVP